MTTINNFSVSLLTVILIVLSNGVVAAPGHGASVQDDRTSHDGHHKNSHHDHGGEVSAVGSPASKSNATLIVKVKLTDKMKIHFSENLGKIVSGTTVTFEVFNEGAIPHEFSIGNAEEQKAHLLMMRKMPGMVHEDGNSITLEPGSRKSLTWTFEGEETVVFSCNIPGHYEAGMYQKVPMALGKG